MELASFVPQISAAWLAVSAAAVPLLQWGLTTLLDMRRDRRSDSVSVGNQMASMIEALQRELDRVNATRAAYAADLDRLRTARWVVEDRMEELRDAAIAARAMVHELERQSGLPDTQFSPLPHPVAHAPRAPPEAA